MKLSRADITMFTRTTVPVKLEVNSLATRLARFISFPETPRHEVNIYVARYAIDLQLPGKSNNMDLNSENNSVRAFDLPKV